MSEIDKFTTKFTSNTLYYKIQNPLLILQHKTPPTLIIIYWNLGHSEFKNFKIIFLDVYLISNEHSKYQNNYDNHWILSFELNKF